MYEKQQKKIVWQPQPGSQQLFLSCPVFEVLLEGNRGGGKTDALIMDFLQFVGKGFGASWIGLLLRETYKNLEDVRNKSKKWIPRIFPNAKFNETGNVWTFETGERLYFSYAKRPGDYRNYHGHEYPWIAWEELTNWADLSLYVMMMSVCRSSNPNMPRHYRATCNPWGKGHNQVKKRFQIGEISQCKIIEEKKYIEELKKEVVRDRCFIHSNRAENKIFTAADPEYVLSIESQTDPNLRKAWLDGDWNITSGGMFDDLWNKDIHVLPFFQIPCGWYVDRNFDYGTSHPFSVGWWAQCDGSPVEIEYNIVIKGTVKTIKSQKTFPKGTLIRIWELYGCDKNQENKGIRLSSNEIGKAIKEEERKILAKFNNIDRIFPGVADSSIFDSDHNNESIIQNINSGFGNMTTDDIFVKSNKSPGSRSKRWQLIRDRLQNSLSFPIEKKGIFVMSHCKDFLRTVPCISRDEKNLDDIDTDVEDHIADETGYRVLHEPITSKIVQYRIG